MIHTFILCITLIMSPFRHHHWHHILHGFVGGGKCVESGSVETVSDGGTGCSGGLVIVEFEDEFVCVGEIGFFEEGAGAEIGRGGYGC
jgi:hypothetical protein